MTCMTRPWRRRRSAAFAISSSLSEENGRDGKRRREGGGPIQQKTEGGRKEGKEEERRTNGISRFVCNTEGIRRRRHATARCGERWRKQGGQKGRRRRWRRTRRKSIVGVVFLFASRACSHTCVALRCDCAGNGQIRETAAQRPFAGRPLLRGGILW